MLASRENLDWIKEAPKMSYNEILGRPVFLNREAFYVCLSGLHDPSIFEKVEFDLDSNFKNYYKKATGDGEYQPALVSQFIGKMVATANDDYRTFEATEGCAAFMVPPDDPNTAEKTSITWLDTHKLDRATQSFNEKSQFYQDETEETTLERLSDEISKEVDTYDNYPSKNLKK